MSEPHTPTAATLTSTVPGVTSGTGVSRTSTASLWLVYLTTALIGTLRNRVTRRAGARGQHDGEPGRRPARLKNVRIHSIFDDNLATCAVTTRWPREDRGLPQGGTRRDGGKTNQDRLRVDQRGQAGASR